MDWKRERPEKWFFLFLFWNPLLRINKSESFVIKLNSCTIPIPGKFILKFSARMEALIVLLYRNLIDKNFV